MTSEWTSHEESLTLRPSTFPLSSIFIPFLSVFTCLSVRLTHLQLLLPVDLPSRPVIYVPKFFTVYTISFRFSHGQVHVTSFLPSFLNHPSTFLSVIREEGKKGEDDSSKRWKEERYKSVSGLMHHVKVCFLHLYFLSPLHPLLLFSSFKPPTLPSSPSLQIPVFSLQLIFTNLEQTDIPDGPNEPCNNDHNHKIYNRIAKIVVNGNECINFTAAKAYKRTKI